MRAILLNCLVHAAQADVDLTNTVRPLASFRAHFTDCSTCSLDQVLDSCQAFPSTGDRAIATSLYNVKQGPGGSVRRFVIEKQIDGQSILAVCSPHSPRSPGLQGIRIVCTA